MVWLEEGLSVASGGIYPAKVHGDPDGCGIDCIIGLKEASIDIPMASPPAP
jgi:hypothetical protein